MKLVIDGKNIDISKTKINLNTDSNEAHQQMQFIERYFRGMFNDKLDVSKIHFYSGNPSRNRKEIEITPDQAMNELQTGYPILVKHDDIKDVMPFVKRRGADDKYTLYTGREILGVQKHGKPDLGFDFESFRREPKPPKPGFWENIFIKIGFMKSNERYDNYQEYLRKSAILEENKLAVAKYDCEKAAYKLAENVDEMGLEEFLEVMDKEPEKEEPLKDIDLKMVEPKDIDENISIDNELGLEPEGKKVYPKARAKNNPLLPPDKKAELLDRKKTTIERKKLNDSKFVAKVKDEIRGKDLSNEEVYKNVLDKLEEERKNFSYSGSFSTKEHIEHARVLNMVDEKLDASNKKADITNAENKNFALISAKEYDSLEDDKKDYFVKYYNNNYIERAYLVNKKDTEIGIEKEVKTADVVVDKDKEKKALEAYSKEDSEEVKVILKDINAKRETVRNNIARSITDSLLAYNKNLDKDKTLETVRFGYTFKKLTADANKLEELADLLEQGKTKELRNAYTKELKSLEKSVFSNFKGEPKKVEKVEAVKTDVENKNEIKEEAPKLSL